MDIPTIQFIIQEAVNSGIEEILIITNSNKHCMENHFDRSYELEDRLRQTGKLEECDMLCDIANMANIYYVRQKEPKGLGHAILCAKTFVGNEPFAVLLGDDIVVNEDSEPALKQIMHVYDDYGASVVGVQTVPHELVDKYGIIAPCQPGDLHDRRVKVSDLVEKPGLDEAPSDMAILGRYVLTPEIFDILENQAPGKNGEIQLTDAICTLLDSQAVYAYDFEGVRYDVGDKFGFIQATIDFALKRPDIKDKLQAYIKQLSEEL